MSSTRSQLLTRKADLYSSLELLEQDRREGMIDDDAYRQSRQRYEQDAAVVLAELDHLPDVERAPVASAGRRPILVGASGILVVVALAATLVSALHQRGTSGTVTGDVGQVVPTPVSTASARITAAEAAARRHPRDVSALIVLGNVYLDSGKSAAADRAYLRAMHLAPGDPQPPTLHAMVTGFDGHFGQAQAMLRAVERAHPRFGRAWLLDGLFSANGLHQYQQGIAAWQRFLALNPHGSLAPQVRRWIESARTAAAKR